VSATDNVTVNIALVTCSALFNPGYTDCGNACAKLTSDPQNCGACGHVCPGVSGGYPVCNSGTCSLACSIGYVLIGGACASREPPPVVCPAGKYDKCGDGICYASNVQCP